MGISCPWGSVLTPDLAGPGPKAVGEPGMHRLHRLYRWVHRPRGWALRYVVTAATHCTTAMAGTGAHGSASRGTVTLSPLGGRFPWRQ